MALTRQQRIDRLNIQREKARRRAKRSFRYFVENFCHIPLKDDAGQLEGKARFKLWPKQLEILPKLLTALLLIVLKTRQLGLTWMCAALALWYVLFKKNFLVVVISAKGDWAVEFLERVYFMLRYLPLWLYDHVKIEKDTTEVFRVKFLDDDSESTIKSLTTTESGAQSKTPDLVILDETCWNPYIKQIFEASKPGVVAAGGRIIVISNSIKTAPGWFWTREIYINSMRGLNDFVRVFLDPWARPDRNPATFREQELRGGMDEESFIQHYPMSEDEAISTMLGSYFGRTLERHSKTLLDLEKKGFRGAIGDLVLDKKTNEIEFQRDPKGILEIWRFPYHLSAKWNGDWWTKRYCGGSDVSEGLGQSFSVGYIKDRKLDELVCRIRSNRVDAHTWAKLLWMLGKFYQNAVDYTEQGLTYQDALWCVERTGAGQTTVDEMQKRGANQYVEEVPGTTGKPITHRLGWTETEQRKHDLSEDLRNWFKIMQGTIYCPVLIDEASTWIQYEGSRRIGPEEGHFGDCVIAAGMTEQASIFMEGSPKKLIPPLTGWRARLKEASKKDRIWVN